MLTEASKRDTVLNCHISAENKKWLSDTSDHLNRPMGDIVDEIITHVRDEHKKEMKAKPTTKKKG